MITEQQLMDAGYQRVRGYESVWYVGSKGANVQYEDSRLCPYCAAGMWMGGYARVRVPIDNYVYFIYVCGVAAALGYCNILTISERTDRCACMEDDVI